MIEPPPLMRDQRKVDAEHLRLLAVFHFVVAGLAVAGTLLLGLHYLFLRTFLSNPETWRSPRGGGPSPEAFFSIFKWFYLFFGVVLVLSALVNVLSGLFIERRRFRTFSMVVAAIDCIQIPFGTVLGVFTLVVLVRDSVMEVYES